MRKQFLALLGIVTLITLLPSCRFVVRSVNNMKKPKTESSQSVNAWLKSKGLDKYEVLTVAPEIFFDATSFYVKRKLIFNSEGKVAELGTNNTGIVCHFRTPGEVRNLKPGYDVFTDFLIEYYRQAVTEKDMRNGNYIEGSDTVYYNLDSLGKYAHSLEGKKVNIKKDSEADYVAVIPFAIYQGNTLQLTEIRQFLKAIEDNKHSTFKVILLNLDKQEWWGKEWNEKIKMMTGVLWKPSLQAS